MAYAFVVYTGDGSTTQFSIPFSYIRKEHVKVYVNYVDTAYTYVNDTTVSVSTAPGSGVRVEVRRVTPANTPLVDFANGAVLTAADLDTANLQQLYLTQEVDDDQGRGVVVDDSNGLITAQNQRITNVATPTASTDAANKNYIDTFVNQTANIADSAVTSAKIADGTIVTADLADSSVTSAKIVDGTIATGDIADAAVTTAKVADSNVTTAKIADLNVTSGKLSTDSVLTSKIADGNVTTAKLADSGVTTAKIADSNVTTAKVADANITTAKVADSAITGAKIASSTIDSSKLTGATVVTNSEVAGVTVNDTSFFTTSASDLRYFRQDSSETITSGVAWSGSDNFIATTAAIDARIVDLVDDVGGFVPIANETSFPAANPDVNNGAGTLISIQGIVTARTPSSGTVTIANGSGSNTVTITGCGSTVLAAGYGLIVETTSTLHTYAFHRLVPRATEVTTVAGISADITTAAANVADINNFADVYQINNADPTQRADTTALQTGDLVYRSDLSVIRAYNGTVYQNITPDAATLADISVVADDLATFDDLGSVADALTAAQSGGALETCADNIADIRALADIEDGTTATDAISNLAAIRTNVTTVAGSISNVNTVAGSIGNVNTVAGRDADIGTLADIEDGTVATDAISNVNAIRTNVTTVAGISSNVTTVANTSSDVTTVAGQISPTNNVSTVAGAAANIATVAGQISPTNNISTVAGAAANVGTVAGSIANVNTVAGSIADVNRYAQEYTISATAPASPSEGDLWYDSTNNVLKFYDGTSFASISAGISQVSDDTSPTLGGALDANGNNISNVGTIDGTNLSIDFGTL